MHIKWNDKTQNYLLWGQIKAFNKEHKKILVMLLNQHED